jgi:hypothetical protein
MYNIVRSYKNGTPEIIEEDVTLAEAQAHCQNPATKGEDWFDGYVDSVVVDVHTIAGDEQADNNTLESI